MGDIELGTMTETKTTKPPPRLPQLSHGKDIADFVLHPQATCHRFHHIFDTICQNHYVCKVLPCFLITGALTYVVHKLNLLEHLIEDGLNANV